MEYWNDGVEGILSFLNKIFSAFAPVFHFSNIPPFHVGTQKEISRSSSLSIPPGWDGNFETFIEIRHKGDLP